MTALISFAVAIVFVFGETYCLLAVVVAVVVAVVFAPVVLFNVPVDDDDDDDDDDDEDEDEDKELLFSAFETL